MTGPGDSHSEMPSFPWPTRPDARAFDALLSGRCRPEEAPAQLRPVAEVLMALQDPPEEREVARWDEALSAYRGMAGRPNTSGRSRARRTRLSTRLAAAASVAALALLGGGVAAAYTGLPPIFHTAAHTVAAHGVRGTRATPTPRGPVDSTGPRGTGGPHATSGPPATGSGLQGLCQAYRHAEARGDASRWAAYFRKLLSQAGWYGTVEAYCAVEHHGAANRPGRRAGQASPTAHPSHHLQPTTVPGQGTWGGQRS